jgi:hypothetical protein
MTPQRPAEEAVQEAGALQRGEIAAALDTAADPSEDATTPK